MRVPQEHARHRARQRQIRRRHRILMQRIGLDQIVLRIVLNHRRHFFTPAWAVSSADQLKPRARSSASISGSRPRNARYAAAGIHAVADAHDVIVQTLCNAFVEGITGLHERLERVVIQHLGPQIAVVARRIRRRSRKYAQIAACDGASPPRPACRAPASVSRSKASESGTGPLARCSFMSTSAAARYSTVANPWLNGSGRLDLGGQCAAGIGSPVRTCSANCDKQLGHRQPVLVQLRRKLDEVAHHVGAGQRRIIHVGVQACAARGRTRGTASPRRPS